MAIDMIENNELSALAPSRLGLNQFADDGFKNYVGDDEFYNLFGSRARKKSRIRDAVRAKYVSLPTDCDRIQNSIDIISNDVETLLKQKQNLQQREALDETNIILGEYKKLLISQDCAAIKAKAEKEQQRAATLDTLTQLGDVSVQKAQAELQGLQAGAQQGSLDNKKILLYGGIGVGALLLFALILRK